MRVVVLSSETPSNVWLVNQLLARHEVVGVIIERRPLALTVDEKLRRRRDLMRRYGFFRALNKLVYNKFKERFVSGSEDITIRDHFFPSGAPVAYASQVATVVVENVNDAACISFIEEKRPDVLAVCGTTVIKPEVFSLAKHGAINIHTGITPEYRCADPIFWALYNGETEKVGVTIHYIDSGIDTGPIILQETVPVYRDDSLASIFARCVRRGSELYSQALSRIEGNAVQIERRVGAQSRAFLSIDLGIVQYLLFRLRFYFMAKRLPGKQGAAFASKGEFDGNLRK